MSKVEPKFLWICVDDQGLKEFEPIFSGKEIEKFNSEVFFERYEELTDGVYAMIIVGGSDGMDLAYEAAQITQLQCPQTPTIFATTEKHDFHPKKLKKNGFNEAFLLPLDGDLFKEQVTTALASFSGERVFKKIRTMDVQSGTTLDFDTYVFLPLNKKYVPFSKANQEFSEAKAEKLTTHHVNSLHIDQKNMDSFYSYMASHLDVSAGNGMSETEKEEKLADAIRNVFYEVLDNENESTFQSGKDNVEQCQKIVSNYITNGDSSNWYASLIRLLGGESSGYSHSANVSSIGALFAIGTNYPNPEDIAIAGFFHDLGLVGVDEHINHESYPELSEADKKIYELHPQNSVNALKTKKMVISPDAEKAILEHHEMFNGKGFPRGFVGERISRGAQLLSLADQFNYLTSEVEGKERLSPQKALEAISANGSINPELIRKVQTLLPSSEGQ